MSCPFSSSTDVAEDDYCAEVDWITACPLWRRTLAKRVRMDATSLQNGSLSKLRAHGCAKKRRKKGADACKECEGRWLPRPSTDNTL